MFLKTKVFLQTINDIFVSMSVCRNAEDREINNGKAKENVPTWFHRDLFYLLKSYLKIITYNGPGLFNMK